MKRRIMTIVLLTVFMAALHPVPPAKADPLTIMAIVGLVTVASAGTADLVASGFDDDRDQRARQEPSEKMLAKTVQDVESAGSSRTEETVQR